MQNISSAIEEQLKQSHVQYEKVVQQNRDLQAIFYAIIKVKNVFYIGGVFKMEKKDILKLIKTKLYIIIKIILLKILY